MPLEYSISESLDDIMPILTDHMEWYDAVQSALMFPAATHKKIERPASFQVWFQKAQTKDFVDRPALDRLQTIYYSLHETAQHLVDRVSQARRALGLEEFQSLSSHHKEFCAAIRAYERDSILEHGGLDALTALRNWKQIRKDLKIEMDRLSRDGKSFTVALVRIDQYDALIKEYSPSKAHHYLKIASDLIKKSVRTFDDAYRTQDDKFLLSLKQSDISGGIAALERLRGFLEERGETIRIAGRAVPLSMSCAIAAPVPEQNIDELLNNLDEDLAAMTAQTGAVLEYFETGQMQKYTD